MAGNLSLASGCFPPFVNAAGFGNEGGFVPGRFCAPMPGSGVFCCLPCPATDFIYPESFTTWNTVAEWINVAGFILMAFLLVSYIFLPAEKTRRHYLSVCLVVTIMSLALGFIVPLGVRPDQCYDEITPNDMYSDLTCAWSGAFLIAGGVGVAVWIFIRALSMHLQICWDVTPGQRFFYWAQALGWGVTALLFTVTITLTGVSYRFGSMCHVNSDNSTADFWGPLLAFAGASALLQIGTFAYCINVYLRNMWSDEKTDTQSSGGLPSINPSLRTHSARAIYRRVRKVLWLQWRGLMIVVFILIDVILFSAVFIYLNAKAKSLSSDYTQALPFLLCLMQHPNDRGLCMNLGQKALMNESTVIAILVILSFAGIQTFVLLFRGSVFTAWVDYFRGKMKPRNEFVSLDARRFSADARSYEMLKPGGGAKTPTFTKAETVSVTSPAETYASPISLGRNTPDYFSKEMEISPKEERVYRSPSLSFSTPRPPSSHGRDGRTGVDWDPKSTYARGGLGLHPPLREDVSDLPGGRV